jgi:polyhydroxybutyrate depolymerase
MPSGRREYVHIARRIARWSLVVTTLFVAPAAFPRTGSPGPGPEPIANFHESIVTADGRRRTYVLHLPTGYTPTKIYPLVLVFHGGYGWGAQILSMMQFAAKADEAGFIVVAPDGIDRHWNDGRGTANSKIDDVSFVRQLINNLESRFAIDPKRIYATGISNGGVFTQRLGCELSDTLAAIGTAAGPIAAKLLPFCKPKPLAVVGIQGTADPLTPLEGGEGVGGLVASTAQTMRLWATVNGCNATPIVTNVPLTVNDGTSVDEYSYSGCTAGTNVVYFIVKGMGHVWPPVEGVGNNDAFFSKITGPTSRNINATDRMWDFFNAHAR